MSESPWVAFPTTAPTGSGITVIFDSTTLGPKTFLRLANVNRVETVIQNNQTGTLNGYWSADGGTSWNLYNTQAVTVPAAGASSGPFDYHVDPYQDFKIEWVNGGTAQTIWRGSTVLVCGDRPKAT